MKHIIDKLRTSATIIRSLPELPGYNGSVLMIDDVEATRIEADISDCVAELEEKFMPLQGDKEKEFEALSRPLCEWLAKNYHPHVTIILDSGRATVYEGLLNTLQENRT